MASMTKREMIESVLPVRVSINVAQTVQKAVLDVYGVEVSNDYAFSVWDAWAKEQIRKGRCWDTSNTSK